MDAARVRLVAEVTSPATAGVDRILKARFYEQAAIPGYLMVDPVNGDVHGLELVNRRYAESSDAGMSIAPAELLPPE